VQARPGVAGIQYEVFILTRMIEQLPPTISPLLLGQLQKVIDSFATHHSTFCAKINAQMDDAILALTLTEFDLHATRNERDDYKQKLKDTSS
jgi:hypothetical protein